MNAGGADAPLLDRIRRAARSLETCPPGPTKTAGAELLARIRGAVADRDVEAATRLVGALEALLPSAPERGSDRVVLFEEQDVGLPPRRSRRRRLARWPAPIPPAQAPAPVPPSVPAPVPVARPVVPETLPRPSVPAPGPVPRRSVTAAIRAELARIAHPSRTARIRLAVSVVLGLLFMLVVGLAAHWRLLYGIDTPGIYTPQDFFYRPSVDVALPSFLALLDGSNPYVTLYLTLGLEAGAISYCVQLLTGALARGSFRGSAVIAVEALAAMLYLANPYILSFGTTSLYSNVLVSNAAFIAFLAILVTVLWEVRHGIPISRRRAVLMGLAIGLANPYAFPNFLRIQAMVMIALGLAFLIILTTAALRRIPPAGDPHPVRRTVGRFLAYTLPPAALLVAYPLYSTAETYLGPTGPLKSIIASQPYLNVTSHNTFPLVVRLLGKGTLHIFAYASQLNGSGPVAASSWAWPFVALGLPLAIALLTRRPRFLPWKTVVALEAFAWMALAWSASNNPPFGAVIGPIVRAAPALIAAFPDYYLEYQVLTIIYPILAAASIVWLGTAVASEVAGLARATGFGEPPERGRRAESSFALGDRSAAAMSGRAVVVVIAVLLLVVATPVASGQSLAASSRVTPGGFVIPSEYGTLRTQLFKHPGNDLLLPGVQSHLQTSWGYDGASSWYTLWNYPIQVIQPAAYGPFQILQPSVARTYANLTAPLVPTGNATGPTVSNYHTANVSNGSTPSITLGWNLNKNTTNNWTGFTWVGAQFDPRDPLLFGQEILAGDVEAGIATMAGGARHVGWFPLGTNPNSQLYNLSGGAVSVRMLAPFPTTGQINLGNVVGLEIRIFADPNTTDQSVTLQSVQYWSGNALSANWGASLGSSQVVTLLTDTNLINGTNAPVAYGQIVVGLAEAAGIATEIWQSPHLTLYAVNQY